ncbi:hypothetical protein BDR05DRAFT_951618 [Suillus weaverae]|nr:hypothetical protein BDR05DRAFT_951618 [Suillus weaverae]
MTVTCSDKLSDMFGILVQRPTGRLDLSDLGVVNLDSAGLQPSLFAVCSELVDKSVRTAERSTTEEMGTYAPVVLERKAERIRKSMDAEKALYMEVRTMPSSEVNIGQKSFYPQTDHADLI